MVTRNNKRSGEKEERKGRVRVGKLETARELSAEEARKVKGGRAGGDKREFLIVKLSDVLIT